MSNNKTPRVDESDSNKTKVLKNLDDNNNMYNNDVQMNTLDNSALNKSRKKKRINRNYRVFVLYKNNTELTREFLISQLQVKSDNIVNIIEIKSLNAAVIYCKNSKIMELIVKKIILDFTFVLQSKFSNYKYKVIAPFSKNNIYEIMKVIEDKGYKLLTLNIVTTTEF
ncbi:hypothetical protein ABK040_016121 [Willaertia magna]